MNNVRTLVTQEGREAQEEWNEAVDLVDGAKGKRDEQAKTLIPYSDNLPYDRNRVIQEAKFCLAVEIQARFEVGRRLLLLREHEGVATLQQILQEHFSGLERTTAWRYMTFARKAASLPKFQAWANGRDNWSKALTIMQAVEEEDLAEFEDGSVLGIPVEELDRLSVRELKSKIKKLEKEKVEGFERADKKLVQENKKLEEELEVLKARQEPGTAEAVTMVRSAEKKILDSFKLLMEVPRDLIGREPMLRDMLLGTCGLVLRVVENFEALVSEAGQIEQ